jgi:hypothetical protein
MQYCENSLERCPIYLFDEIEKKAPALIDDYEVPEYFNRDFFNLITNHRPHFRWILIGLYSFISFFYFLFFISFFYFLFYFILGSKI